MKILQLPLTTELKQNIYAGFKEQAIQIMGQNGIVLQGDKTIDELKRRLRNTKPESFGEVDFNK